MNGDGLVVLQPGAKILPFQHPRQAVVTAQPHHVVTRQLIQPLAVVADFRFLGIEEFKDLREVRLGIRVNLLPRQRWAGFGLSGGVADHGREIANQENRGVPEVLKVLELTKDHGVSEMNVRGRWVHAEIHAQRLSSLGRLLELRG